MKLKTHLILKFGILLLLLIGISAASYYGVQKLNYAYQNAITLQTPELKTLEEIKRQAEELETIIIKLETLQKGNSLKEKHQLLSTTEKIKDELDKYEHTHEYEINDLKERINQLILYSIEYIKLKEQDARFEEANSKRIQLRETQHKILTSIDKLIQKEQELLQKQFEKTQNAVINSTILTLAIAAALIIVLAITTANQISQPLKNISETINLISTGNLQAKIKDESTIEEIHELTESLNRVTASLKIAIERVGIQREDILQPIKEQLELREKQQQTITQLGELALTEELNTFLQKSTELIKQALKTDYCRILEYQPSKKQFLLIAGTGWKKGIVGKTIPTDLQAEYSFTRKELTIVTNFQQEKKFKRPPLLEEHGIASGMSITIGNYGILGVHTKTPRTYAQQDTIFLQSAANTITEAITLNRIKNELKETSETYYKLFDNAPVMYFVLDDKGKIQHANQSGAQQLGYKQKELIGQDVTKVFHPQDKKKAQDHLTQALKQPNKTHTWELRKITKDGKTIKVKETVKIIQKDKPKILITCEQIK